MRNACKCTFCFIFPKMISTRRRLNVSSWQFRCYEWIGFPTISYCQFTRYNSHFVVDFCLPQYIPTYSACFFYLTDSPDKQSSKLRDGLHKMLTSSMKIIRRAPLSSRYFHSVAHQTSPSVCHCNSYAMCTRCAIAIIDDCLFTRFHIMQEQRTTFISYWDFRSRNIIFISHSTI